MKITNTLALAACTLFLGSALLGAAGPASASLETERTQAALAQAPLGQDEPEDGRDQIKEQISKLADHADQRGKEDQEAIAVIDVLLQEYPRSGPKDKAAIVKALDKCFKEKRPEQEGGRQNQLFLAAATALGEMAPESVDALVGWIDHKTHRRDLALQRVLILKAGSTKSPKALKEIVKLLKHHEAQMQSAAAEALGNFDDCELKLRKETFETLLKTMMNVKGQVDTDPTDTIARQRWDVISAPIITSLQALSGQELRAPQEWLHWWNKNKKADWDA